MKAPIIATLTNPNVGRQWVCGDWRPDRYEITLPPETIEPPREYLRELGRLCTPIYTDA